RGRVSVTRWCEDGLPRTVIPFSRGTRGGVTRRTSSTDPAPEPRTGCRRVLRTTPMTLTVEKAPHHTRPPLRWRARPVRRCAVNGSEPGQLARRPETSASALPDDAQIVAGLRAGDEELFADVIEVWAPTMLRLARSHVHTRESAADIVQETWLAVLRGIDRFEGRSALRTWVSR